MVIRNKTLWSIALMAFLLAGNLYAQQIRAEVKFFNEHLPSEEKLYIEDLDKEIARLIDTYTWTNGGYKYELPIRIELYFDKYSQSALYHRYGAGIMVASPSGIQLRDRRWDFRYSREYRVHMGEPYDPFTGLIEFYIWICLGFEADRFTPLGGQPFYEKARMISENARFEAKYNLGWDYRRDFINALTQDNTYRNLRTAAYHVYSGIYYVENNDPSQARSHLMHAAEIIMAAKPEMMAFQHDDHIIRFVDIKKYVEALKKIEAQHLLSQLSEWDSENAELYK